MKNNDNRLGDLFEKARNQQPEASFDEVKGKFLENLQIGASPTMKLSEMFNLKFWIMLSSISAIVATTIILYFSTNNEANSNEISLTTSEKVIETDKTTVSEENTMALETIEIKEDKIYKVSTSFIKDSVSNQFVQSREEELYENKAEPIFIEKPSVDAAKKEPYRFPSLTPEEIKGNHKQKAKMLKQLAKLDVKKYAYVPAGSFLYNNDTVSVQAFFIQTTEVSNLEYRTFLFDLLIQNRKEDFLKAKPEQRKWLEMAVDGINDSVLEPMTDLYFSHQAYNEYPVVNVSREGVKMYCKWLTSEVRKADIKKKKMDMNQDVRLPFDTEWAHAAMGYEDDSDFPWKGTFARNSRGLLLANFKPLHREFHTTKEGKRVFKVSDSSKFDYAQDGGYFPVRVSSYEPNDYGLYCISGNVAEMVWSCPEIKKEEGLSRLNYCDRNERIPGTKGGGWNSELKEIKITGIDKYRGVTEAHANIGFRVVFTYLGRNFTRTNFQNNSIKITPKTTNHEIELFKEHAESMGVSMEYKTTILNKKIRSITITMDNDDNPETCGGTYYKNGFFGGEDNYVFLKIIERKYDLPELIMEYGTKN